MNGMDRVEPKPVEAIIAQPHQARCCKSSLAHLVTVLKTPSKLIAQRRQGVE